MRLNHRLYRLTLVLIGIFFIGFVNQIWGAEKKSTRNTKEINLPEADGNGQDVSGANGHRIIVYYFHGNNRCYTCRRIEQLTKQAVTESFSKEIKAGQLQMQIINVDEKENNHFSRRYKLFTRSVVVSETESGKEIQWKNLQKVWELVHDDKAFKAYIRQEIQAYLL